jgi:UV DNA damage endonuclease
MRISSDLAPHYSNPKAPKYTLDFIKKDLREIGRLARLYKQRLTFHPGQFNVLSTEKEQVFINTKNELKMHADILDAMGMDQNSVIIIHGGGIYGDKESAIIRFITNFNRLDENTKRRLVIENCESCYNIEDVLYISNIINVPVIFDTHHYSCYNLNKKNNIKEANYYIPHILETWKKRNIKPKFHISEQRPNSRVGSHSDYVECIPEYLLEIPEKYGINIDIMIEAKMKEKSVFHLYENYPQLSPY